MLMYYGIMIVTATAFSAVLYAVGAEYEVFTKASLWATALAGLITIPIARWLMRQDDRRVSLRQRYGVMKAWEMIWMLVLGAALALVVNMVMNLLHIFQLFPSYTEEVSPIMYSNPMWVTILCGAVVAPVIEELIFRGLVYRRIQRRWGTGWGIVASAVLFGVFHGNVPQFIYATVLGILFAWFMEHFHTIKASILLHVGANLWSFLLSYQAAFWENFGKGIPLVMILLLQTVIVAASVSYMFINPLYKHGN